MLYALVRDELTRLQKADWSAEFPGAEMVAVRLTSSPYDPLGEVPVRELVVCAYGRFDNAMLPGKVVGRAWWLPGFLKHAFFKVDVAPFKLGWVDDVTSPPSTEEK